MAAPPPYRCGACGFELWLTVTGLAVSTLGLYDDARFPGRCLLALDEHADDFSMLPRSLRERYLDDVQRAAQAITAVTGAGRINYAVLGNVEEHVHFHLIPRGRAGDPVPRKAPWAHPDPVHPLPAEEKQELIAALSAALRA